MLSTIKHSNVSLCNTLKRTMDVFKDSPLLACNPLENLYSPIYGNTPGNINSNAPKRQVIIKPLKESLAEVLKITEQVEEVASSVILSFASTRLVGDQLATNYSFEEFLRNSITFSEKSFHLLSRSYYMAFLYIVGPLLDEMLLNSMASRGLPPKLLKLKNSVREWIFSSPTLASWESIKLCSLSRGRLFSRLENVISLWGNVTTEALYLDERINEEVAAPSSKFADLVLLDHHDNNIYWVATWTVVVCTTIMDLHMQLIAEMGILEQHELDSFYWYWDYLHSTHLHAIDKLQNHCVRLAMKSSKSTDAESLLRSLQLPIDGLSRIKGQLCRGVFRMVIVCKRLKLIDGIDQDTASVVFYQRFKPFHEIINPSPLNYLDFKITIGKDVDEVESSQSAALTLILASASSCFQMARALLEEQKKIDSAFFAQCSSVSLLKVRVLLL
jgi:hypothetical protein